MCIILDSTLALHYWNYKPFITYAWGWGEPAWSSHACDDNGYQHPHIFLVQIVGQQFLPNQDAAQFGQLHQQEGYGQIFEIKDHSFYWRLVSQNARIAQVTPLFSPTNSSPDLIGPISFLTLMDGRISQISQAIQKKLIWRWVVGFLAAWT